MLLPLIIIFFLAAGGGVFLIYFILNKKETPKGIAVIHGSAAALGLMLLILYSATHPTIPLLSLVLFIMAASLGFVLIYKDLTTDSPLKKTALAHGGFAVAALLCLIVFFLK